MSGFELRPFRLSDLDAYRNSAAEFGAREWFSVEGLSSLEKHPGSQTLTVDAVPICSGGLFPNGHIGVAWAVLSEIPKDMVLSVHRVYRKAILASGYQVIETYVSADFMPSHRWVRLLGFEMDERRPTAFFNRSIFVRYIFKG